MKKIYTLMHPDIEKIYLDWINKHLQSIFVMEKTKYKKGDLKTKNIKEVIKRQLIKTAIESFNAGLGK